MIQLDTFFDNPFDDPKISHSKFGLFAEDHVVRLHRNNPDGLYDERHALTKAALIAYREVLGRKGSEEATSLADTAGFKSTKAEILKGVRQLEVLVTLRLKRKSSVYIQFFPKGLTEFIRARKGQLGGLLDRLRKAAERHKITLKEDVTAEFDGYITLYQTVESGQSGNKGGIAKLRMDLVQRRKALSTQLYINLHMLAMHNPGNPKKVRSYFDQSLVTPRTKTSRDGLGRGVLAAFRNGEEVENFRAVFYDFNGRRVGTYRSKGNGVRTPNIAIGLYKVVLKKDGLPNFTLQLEVFDDKVVEVEMEWG